MKYISTIRPFPTRPLRIIKQNETFSPLTSQNYIPRRNMPRNQQPTKATDGQPPNVSKYPEKLSKLRFFKTPNAVVVAAVVTFSLRQMQQLLQSLECSLHSHLPTRRSSYCGNSGSIVLKKTCCWLAKACSKKRSSFGKMKAPNILLHTLDLIHNLKIAWTDKVKWRVRTRKPKYQKFMSCLPRQAPKFTESEPQGSERLLSIIPHYHVTEIQPKLQLIDSSRRLVLHASAGR